MRAKRFVGSSVPGALLGVVEDWEERRGTPGANEEGGARGHVRLDDGRVVDAFWGGAAVSRRELRPSSPGDRVRVSRSSGKWRAVLVEARKDASPTPCGPPPRPPPKPLPAMLARAVAASLAAGESPTAIAERWGLDVRQVRSI